jgi:hypothetical protein
MRRHAPINLLVAAFCIASLGLTANANAEPQAVQLGSKQAGKTYPLTLGAENKNCPQPLDFRFTSQTPWIRMPTDPVARQIPQGQTRDLNATIDLNGLAPGPYQGNVEVQCDNCGWFIFQNCKIDKQVLWFYVQVTPNVPGSTPTIGDPPAPLRTPEPDGKPTTGDSAQPLGRVTDPSEGMALMPLPCPPVPVKLLQDLDAAKKALDEARERSRICNGRLMFVQAHASMDQKDAAKLRTAANEAAAVSKKANAHEGKALERLNAAIVASDSAGQNEKSSREKLDKAIQTGDTKSIKEAKQAHEQAKAGQKAADAGVKEAKLAHENARNDAQKAEKDAQDKDDKARAAEKKAEESAARLKDLEAECLARKKEAEEAERLHGALAAEVDSVRVCRPAPKPKY